MKQFLTILAILIVLTGIGVAAYFLFFAHDAPRLTVQNAGTSLNDAISNDTRTQTNQTTTTNVVGGAGTLIAPGLVQITKEPVAAGVAEFDTFPTPVVIPATTTASSTATTTAPQTVAQPDSIVRYIDRASGNVYEYAAFARTLTRIGNKTLPGIQKASWLKDGSMALVQFLSNTSGDERVQTYALPAVGVGGYFLQEDLDQASIFGSSTIFTLNTDSGTSVGTIARADGTNNRTLFTTPLTAINVFGAGSDYLATSQAAHALSGYLFSINNAGTFTPILGPYQGLTILPSPSGKQVLYSYVDGASLSMHVYDRNTGGVTDLPVATLAEKCVWNADSTALYCAVPTSLSGTLPDDWYQGSATFNDRIWRIDLQTRLAALLLNPGNIKNLSIDAVDLSVDPNNKILVFRNKKDSSLWAYNL